MTDSSKTTDLGRVMVTGGSGFVGGNFVSELLKRGLKVRSFDRVPSPLPDNPLLEIMRGDITDPQSVAAAVDGIDTVFHTASLIEGVGETVTPEMRRRSFDVNVGGTEKLVQAAQKAGVKRFVYTSSNSVVMSGKPISGGDETMPYSTRKDDLYTETKAAAERFVLAQNGVNGVAGNADVCDPPQRHLGPRRPDHVPQGFRACRGRGVPALIGSKNAKLDNSYVKNLVHGHILAAEHLVEGGTAPGQAYFINDDDPVNMFEFARPIIEACGEPWPTRRIPGAPVRMVMVAWTKLKSTTAAVAQGAVGSGVGGADNSGQLLLGQQGPPRPRLRSRCSPPSRPHRTACPTTSSCTSR